MNSPVLHVLAGPNGAGKSTFVHRLLQPITHLPFINADEIAAQQWPTQESEHAYEASAAAAVERDHAFSARRSFITETVFSHPSKLELVRHGIAVGYVINLHVILIPEDVAVLRVADRVSHGGHTVPEAKIRERHKRLWRLVAEARSVAQKSTFYDNSFAAAPFQVIARYESGRRIGEPSWPTWTPEALREAQT